MSCESTKNVTTIGMHEKTKKAVLFQPRCKMWACDECAEMNKEAWIYRALQGTVVIMSEGKRVQFVTLTSRPYATPVTGLYFLKQNWPRLNGRLSYHTNKYRKNSGTEWAYFLVPEQHKTGVVHCHLLCATIYDTEKSWKDFAFQSGFGWSVDVKTIDSAVGAAGYVSKYLHKGAGAEVWPKGFRRVRASQKWPKVVNNALPGWEWASYKNPQTVWVEKNALIDLGWKVEDQRE